MLFFIILPYLRLHILTYHIISIVSSSIASELDGEYLYSMSVYVDYQSILPYLIWVDLMCLKLFELISAYILSCRMTFIIGWRLLRMAPSLLSSRRILYIAYPWPFREGAEPVQTRGGSFFLDQGPKNTSWSFFEAVSNWSPGRTKVTFTLEAPWETISTSNKWLLRMLEWQGACTTSRGQCKRCLKLN